MSALNRLVPVRSLEIHLMPIVRFRARRHLAMWNIFGMEALVRGPVDSPVRRPDQLFAAARVMGLEVSLDLECLRRALWVLPFMPEGQRLFVNIGVETLLGPLFEATILNHLPECWRHRVVLEVIEGEVPVFELARSRIAWLRRLGVAVAIDDLGAGGSDLDRLERLGPVDYVKVDREVLMQTWPSQPEVARAWLSDAVRIARSLGARLLVEGVETSSQDRLGELRALGVGLGQGYLFGEPVASPLTRSRTEQLTWG